MENNKNIALYISTLFILTFGLILSVYLGIEVLTEYQKFKVEGVIVTGKIEEISFSEQTDPSGYFAKIKFSFENQDQLIKRRIEEGDFRNGEEIKLITTTDQLSNAQIYSKNYHLREFRLVLVMPTVCIIGIFAAIKKRKWLMKQSGGVWQHG